MLVPDSLAPQSDKFDPSSASMISYSACAPLPPGLVCETRAWDMQPFEGFGLSVPPASAYKRPFEGYGPSVPPASAFKPEDSLPIARQWTFDGPSRVIEGAAPSLSAATGFAPAACAVFSGASAAPSLPKGSGVEIISIDETLLI